MKTGVTGPKNIFLAVLLLKMIIFQIEGFSQEINTEQNRNSLSTDYSNQQFSVSLGGFLASNNSGITLGSKQLGVGLVLDLEDALGLRTSTFVFRGNVSYFYGRNRQHALIIDYFSINRKALKVLEADLEIGDFTYPIGTRLNCKFDLSIIRAKYDYSFLHDKRVSLGFTAGLFIIPLKFQLTSTSFEAQSADILAPLPVFGLRSDFLIANKFYLKQSAELLYLKIDNFTGSILDLNFALEYKATRHFSLGLGINSYRLNIYAKGNDYPGIDFFGDIKMDYSGIFLYAKFYF